MPSGSSVRQPVQPPHSSFLPRTRATSASEASGRALRLIFLPAEGQTRRRRRRCTGTRAPPQPLFGSPEARPLLSEALSKRVGAFWGGGWPHGLPAS